MTLRQRLAQQSVTHLVRVACILALIGLALMVYGVLIPTPLAIISSMSVAHVFGILAASCYGLAVLLDATHPREPDPKQQSKAG